MVSDNFKSGYRTIVHIRCKMWGCAYCGPQNALEWRAYLLDRFNKAMREEQWCFFTVTAHEKKLTTIDQIKNLQQLWKRLYDRLKRRYGPKNCQYVRVFEPGGKRGRFHMHFLLNCGAAYDAAKYAITGILSEYRHPECKWLRKACRELKAGYIVHIRRVWEERTKTQNVGLVVGYLLKYIGKQLSDFEFPKRQRRIQTSRKIGSPKKSKERRGAWQHMREVPLHMLESSSLPLFDLSTGEVLTRESFEGEHYYPPLRYYRGDEIQKD